MHSTDQDNLIIISAFLGPLDSRGAVIHRADDKARAKYQLTHSVRSHIGADDDAFNAIRQLEDEQGRRGILLQRNVVSAAGQALKTNIAALAPNILPMAELVSRLPMTYAWLLLVSMHNESVAAQGHVRVTKLLHGTGLLVIALLYPRCAGTGGQCIISSCMPAGP